MNVTLYKKLVCWQCTRTGELFDKHEIAHAIIPDISADEHSADLARVKELGYLQAPVVTVEIDDDLKRQIPADEVVFETITKNELARKMITGLRTEGFAHWSGLNPDNIEALAAIKSLVPQLA
ncbi:hypothetical protein KI440_00510 [Candidatus Saccharibacteria bacterium TM7i]|nr:hypothetical protein KI440_00510 [Candidatus Saccharibacteria bacterium TM7i]